MADFSSDDARLRATERQMRRALGLQGEASPAAKPPAPSTAIHPSHTQRRRFVRDGEVPVTVIHRDHSQDDNSTNQLDAARQAIRAQTLAREHAERLLAEAQTTIRDLQTKLAHERLAKDETFQRVETGRQSLEEMLAAARNELAVERADRERCEAERDQAIRERGQAEEQLRQIMLDRHPEKPPDMHAQEPASAGKPRRRGRPPKADRAEPEIVEWWLPGWQERYR